jgi:hypothetical protein
MRVHDILAGESVVIRYPTGIFPRRLEAPQRFGGSIPLAWITETAFGDLSSSMSRRPMWGFVRKVRSGLRQLPLQDRPATESCAGP